MQRAERRDTATERQRARRSSGHDDEPLELVRRRLLRQSFVFDDPAAYRAGVEDAIAAVRSLSARGDASLVDPAVDTPPVTAQPSVVALHGGGR